MDVGAQPSSQTRPFGSSYWQRGRAAAMAARARGSDGCLDGSAAEPRCSADSSYPDARRISRRAPPTAAAKFCAPMSLDVLIMVLQPQALNSDRSGRDYIFEGRNNLHVSHIANEVAGDGEQAG